MDMNGLIFPVFNRNIQLLSHSRPKMPVLFLSRPQNKFMVKVRGSGNVRGHSVFANQITSIKFWINWMCWTRNLKKKNNMKMIRLKFWLFVLFEKHRTIFLFWSEITKKDSSFHRHKYKATLIHYYLSGNVYSSLNYFHQLSTPHQQWKRLKHLDKELVKYSSQE